MPASCDKEACRQAEPDEGGLGTRIQLTESTPYKDGNRTASNAFSFSS